ncbi:MAG: hypothetical protein GC185_00140 [Alphaproteobacteria bacterium]|nr:hypothetical protein [Alphaproteobacteria bacterium]
MKDNRFRRAYDAHRALLAVAAAYVVGVLGEAFWMHVPPLSLIRILSYLIGASLVALVFMTGMYLGTFLYFFFQEASRAGCVFTGRRRAVERLDIAARDYIEGDRFIWGLFGFMALMPDNFFFISKCLIPYVNPYARMKWDFTFAAWDKALHFGHYPDDFVIPAVNAVPGLAHVLDVSYGFWFIVMVLVTGYNLFADTHIHRRLRFLASYLVSWIIFGSVAATVFSSVGPLFVHDFFPKAPDIFADVSANLDRISAGSFFLAEEAREKLLTWTRNDVLFDPNSLSAMPSMHVGIAFLIALYMKEIDRRLFAAAALFCALVFFATLYFGLHYAIDSYVAVAGVWAMWRATGRVLDRAGVPRDARLRLAR